MRARHPHDEPEGIHSKAKGSVKSESTPSSGPTCYLLADGKQKKPAAGGGAAGFVNENSDQGRNVAAPSCRPLGGRGRTKLELDQDAGRRAGDAADVGAGNAQVLQFAARHAAEFGDGLADA